MQLCWVRSCGDFGFGGEVGPGPGFGIGLTLQLRLEAAFEEHLGKLCLGLHVKAFAHQHQPGERHQQDAGQHHCLHRAEARQKTGAPFLVLISFISGLIGHGHAPPKRGHATASATG